MEKDERGPAMEIARRLRGLEHCLRTTLQRNITEEEHLALTARRGIYEGIADDIDRDYGIDSKGSPLTASDVGCLGSSPVDSIRCYDEHSATRMLAYAPRMECRLCKKPSEMFIAVPNAFGFNVLPGYCATHGTTMLRPYERSTVMETPKAAPMPGVADAGGNGPSPGSGTVGYRAPVPIACWRCGQPGQADSETCPTSWCRAFREGRASAAAADGSGSAPVEREPEQAIATMSDVSLIEWAASWVPDQPAGQRERFATALREEMARRAGPQRPACVECGEPQPARWPAMRRFCSKSSSNVICRYATAAPFTSTTSEKKA